MVFNFSFSSLTSANRIISNRIVSYLCLHLILLHRILGDDVVVNIPLFLFKPDVVVDRVGKAVDPDETTLVDQLFEFALEPGFYHSVLFSSFDSNSLVLVLHVRVAVLLPCCLLVFVVLSCGLVV